MILFSLFFLMLPQFIKGNFKIPLKSIEIAFEDKWEFPDPVDDHIKAVLNQPFNYLNRGNQSYVFESQDGKYVLKLFRQSRPRFDIIFKAKSWIQQQLNHFRTHKKKPKKELIKKLIKTFNATQIAYAQAKEFTQVVFFHINLTENRFPKVKLRDRLHAITIPLDRYRFVVQKKVTPFKNAFQQAKAHPEEVEQMIDSFLTLLFERSEKGIYNSDPNLAPNFGFLNGKAVEIDFCNYKEVADSKKRRKEIDGLIGRLEDWLTKNNPEYIPLLVRKINERTY